MSSDQKSLWLQHRCLFLHYDVIPQGLISPRGMDWLDHLSTLVGLPLRLPHTKRCEQSLMHQARSRLGLGQSSLCSCWENPRDAETEGWAPCLTELCLKSTAKARWFSGRHWSSGPETFPEQGVVPQGAVTESTQRGRCPSLEGPGTRETEGERILDKNHGGRGGTPPTLPSMSHQKSWTIKPPKTVSN